MIRKSVILFLFSAICFTSSAQTSDVRPFKTGDKLVSEVIILGTRGREIFNENVSQVEAEVTASPDSYTFKTAQGMNTFSRKGHFLIEAENAQGKRVIPESYRLQWMPPSTETSKPYAVTHEFRATQNCGSGIGKNIYEAVVKPAKAKVKIKGVDQELDVVVVELEGKWQIPGPCGSGRAYGKLIYSAQLDQVLETDFRNFQPNGFLNFGRISRTLSIN